MNILRRFLGAIILWLLGSIIGFALSMTMAGWPTSGGPTMPPPLFLFPLAAVAALPLWLIFFLPLYLGVEGTSLWWHPLASLLVGLTVGLFGALILSEGNLGKLFLFHSEDAAFYLPLFVYTSIFLLGSLLKNRRKILALRLRKSPGRPKPNFGDY